MIRENAVPGEPRQAPVLAMLLCPGCCAPPEDAVQDAVSAIWRERVDVVEAWPDAFFRSPSTTIAVPKIVVLRHYAPVSGEPKFCRRSILLRDRFKCCYCGEPFSSPDLTYDHVIPRSLGGKTEWTNIVTACLKCNAQKADNLPNYSGRKAAGQMRLLRLAPDGGMAGHPGSPGQRQAGPASKGTRDTSQGSRPPWGSFPRQVS
jgi:5-methylcytosine-specific restriction endonuclease McrA